MPVCVMVMADAPGARKAWTQRLRDTDLPLVKCLTMDPPDGDAIDKVALLNPNLTRQQRQRGMAPLADALRFPGRGHLHQDHHPHHLRQLWPDGVKP